MKNAVHRLLTPIITCH